MELLQELWVPYCSTSEMPFQEWHVAFRESLSDSSENVLCTLRVFFPALGLGCCGPGKLPEKWKFPKVVRRGCKRSFGPCEREASCTSAKWGCHRCKRGFGWCKRLLGDLCSLGPKESKRPFAPSPNHFCRLSLLGQFPRSTASQNWGWSLGVWFTLPQKESGKRSSTRKWRQKEHLFRKCISRTSNKSPKVWPNKTNQKPVIEVLWPTSFNFGAPILRNDIHVRRQIVKLPRPKNAP